MVVAYERGREEEARKYLNETSVDSIKEKVSILESKKLTVSEAIHIVVNKEKRFLLRDSESGIITNMVSGSFLSSLLRKWKRKLESNESSFKNSENVRFLKFFDRLVFVRFSLYKKFHPYKKKGSWVFS